MRRLTVILTIVKLQSITAKDFKHAIVGASGTITHKVVDQPNGVDKVPG